MKHVVQDFKDGKIKVIETPIPSVEKGFVLVKNYFSLISVGTERATVSVGSKNIIGKAKARPDLVKKVIDTMKKEGILSTLKKIQSKIEEYKLLGYSTSGIVIDVGEGVREFKIGDRVSCGGGNYAVHADIVKVPKNLCVKIPKNLSLEEASFGTVGAIALQGIRQLSPNIGENVGLIGLGLIGLIILQILKANGCRVFCVDINRKNLELAKRFGADMCSTTDEDLRMKVKLFTDSKYLDGVIISASTPSSEPINQSAQLLRDRGKVIILGNIGMSIEREIFYMKEISIYLSRSYGPGRYDPNYEEKGIDYPIGYVRWTENRNIESFLNLIAEKKVNVKELITHRFNIEDAIDAYKTIMEGKERILGVLFQYPEKVPDEKKVYILKEREYDKKDKVNVGIIGAGNFGKTFILPNLLNNNVNLVGISTQKVANAINVAKKFGIGFATGDYYEIIDNDDIDTIFVLTRHDLHAKIVIDALKRDKNVFVEKPLALNLNEIEDIKRVLNKTKGRLMVGFNRRFSPHSERLKNFIGVSHNPLTAIYRVNAGFLPEEHWLKDPDFGGGRIIGEGCHFIDYMRFITDSPIKEMYAKSSGEKDNKTILLHFEDDSICSIHYITVGDRTFPKERIEVFVDGKIGIIDDFKISIFTQNGKKSLFKTRGISKGYKEEIDFFINSILKGEKSPIKPEEIIEVSEWTIKADKF
uniref:Oxidoreductase n=1 Tax=candidate division WOR-3 bacterium TaxID=2052148 RepID=A0A7C4UC22_UNCW3